MAGNYAKRCAVMQIIFLIEWPPKCPFWMVNHRNTEAKKRSRKSCDFSEWLETMPKHAQIILLIEWPQQVLILRGKQSKYTEAKGNMEQQNRCALMHWSFFLLNDDTKCLFWGVNNRSTEAKRIMNKQKYAPWCTDHFLIEWPHQAFYLRGKLSKYWSPFKSE